MAAVSYSIKRGRDGFKNTDLTKGTLAPNADDVEIRINTTDANSVNMKVKDVIIAIEAFKRAIEWDLSGDWGG